MVSLRFLLLIVALVLLIVRAMVLLSSYAITCNIHYVQYRLRAIAQILKKARLGGFLYISFAILDCNKIIINICRNILWYNMLAACELFLSPLRIRFSVKSCHLVGFQACFFAPNFRFLEQNINFCVYSMWIVLSVSLLVLRVHAYRYRAVVKQLYLHHRSKLACAYRFSQG